MVACIENLNLFLKKTTTTMILLIIMLGQYDLNATFLFSSSLGYGRMYYVDSYMTPITSTILSSKTNDYVLRLYSQSQYLYIPILLLSESPHEVYISNLKHNSKKINPYPSGLIELNSTFFLFPTNFEFLYETPNKKFRFAYGIDVSTILSSPFEINIYKDENLNKNPRVAIDIYQTNKKDIIKILPSMNLEELKILKEEIKPYIKIDKMQNELFKDILTKIEEQEKNINSETNKNDNNNNLRYCYPSKKVFFSFEPYFSFKFKIFDKKYISILIDLNYFPIILTLSSIGNLYLTGIKSYFNNESYINSLGGISIGFSLEKKISEYFASFVRLQLKNYNINSILLSTPRNTRIYSFSSQIGFLFGYPEVQRCKIDMCRIQIKHRHSNFIYRGSNVFAGKDSMGIKLFTPKTTNEETFKPKRKKYIDQYKQELKP